MALEFSMKITTQIGISFFAEGYNYGAHSGNLMANCVKTIKDLIKTI